MARQDSITVPDCYVFVGPTRDRLREERALTEETRVVMARYLLGLAEGAYTAQLARHFIEAASSLYTPHCTTEQMETWRKMSATAARRARILGEEESKLNQF